MADIKLRLGPHMEGPYGGTSHYSIGIWSGASIAALEAWPLRYWFSSAPAPGGFHSGQCCQPPIPFCVSIALILRTFCEICHFLHTRENALCIAYGAFAYYNEILRFWALFCIQSVRNCVQMVALIPVLTGPSRE